VLERFLALRPAGHERDVLRLLVELGTRVVGALDELRYRAGEVIEYVASGEGIRMAVPGGGHTIRTGTSYAAPLVSGLCALLLGVRPDLRPFEVKALLKARATGSR